MTGGGISRNVGIAAALGIIVVGMVGMAYAAVPLYDLFCRVTGYGGTPQVAAGAPVAVGDRVINVRFNADVQSRLPWRFQPHQREMTVRVGEPALATYSAVNIGDQPMVGTATFNVTPLKAGVYFSKIDCFCFEEQFLAAGEAADMPVSFFVDPAIIDDPDMDDVTTITLSYMFFDAGADVRDKYLAANKTAAGAVE